MSPDDIVQIFRRVLNTPEVNASSDFFELGGDSLLATRVLSAIAREFGQELLFEVPELLAAAPPEPPVVAQVLMFRSPQQVWC